MILAKRRMFNLEVVDTDIFIDMPQSTRLLYFDFGMRADDDGFVKDPKKIMRFTGAGMDDLNLLIAKRFIIPFESGVCAITHWKVNNYLRNDRHEKTQYASEMQQITVLENGEYTSVSDLGIPSGSQVVYHPVTQDRLGKDRLVEVSIVKDIPPPAAPSDKQKVSKHKYGEHKNVLLTDEELAKLQEEFPDWQGRIETLSTGIALKGYKYKSHYLAIIKWSQNEAKTTAKTTATADYTDAGRYDGDGW